MFRHCNPERYDYFLNVLDLGIVSNIKFPVMVLLAFYKKCFGVKKEPLNLFLDSLNLISQLMANCFLFEWATLK